MNPYSVMREAVGLSQSDLAKKANLTEQYVRRLEQGTVSAPSGNVIRVLFDYANSVPGMSERLRTKIAHTLHELRKSNMHLPYTGPTTYKNLGELNVLFQEWWDYWIKVSRYRVTSDQVRGCDSIYGLCRLLILHPYTVQRWVKQSRTTATVPLPADIRRALSEAKVSQLAFTDTVREIYND